MASLLTIKTLAICLFPVLISANATSTGYIPLGASCYDSITPVTVTSANYPWIAPKWSDNYGLIDFVSLASSRLDAGFPQPIGPPVNETASYEIAGTFCTPKKPGKNAKTVLLATHGLAFDRRQVHKTFFNPVPLKPRQQHITPSHNPQTRLSGFTNQLNIQTPILISLARSLLNGSLPLPPTPPHFGPPNALILLGHSFGSFLSNSALAADPTIASAAILTSYGLNGLDARLVLEGISPRIARVQDASKFADFDPGYVTTSDVFANINSFFKAPAYEHDVAAFSEANKQPFAISELVSLTPELLRLDARAFKGPTLVISGEYDHVVCGGYCPGELDASFKDKFADLETYVQPSAGHGINFATNTTAFFAKIGGFLEDKGF
ncbi:uncharacterized protein KY384_000759 [Bacidia gigantensis]|uniref:uncharacterized protein n=1 Tax=Bacidia gigantensis TaxID=2732470 RepID=UPI001D036B58|nr:uncharacterized protein KY384_000759 [Bacidia gigantensis]KAG8525997.1 hypothetical protein KY384_000759 [Bacidia gigantensis]